MNSTISLFSSRNGISMPNFCFIFAFCTARYGVLERVLRWWPTIAASRAAISSNTLSVAAASFHLLWWKMACALLPALCTVPRRVFRIMVRPRWEFVLSLWLARWFQISEKSSSITTRLNGSFPFDKSQASSEGFASFSKITPIFVNRPIAVDKVCDSRRIIQALVPVKNK